MRIHTLTPEPMTPERFAPYGTVIDAPEHPAGERRLAPVAFECDGKTTLHTIWQPAAGHAFTRLERHYGVTQTFFQISGPKSVVCVAPPTDSDDPQSVPSMNDVRAFIIDSRRGFAFARGTWHSLDRYVLEPPGATFVIWNVDPNPTQIVDYATGESLMYENLGGQHGPHAQQLSGEFGAGFELAV